MSELRVKPDWPVMQVTGRGLTAASACLVSQGRSRSCLLVPPQKVQNSVKQAVAQNDAKYHRGGDRQNQN
jgi:hypothetical protein